MTSRIYFLFRDSRVSLIFLLPQWELGSHLFIQSPHYTFPDDDLALNLIDLYFSNINLYLPLLHRPTFQKSVSEGLHLTDDRFASIYLLVCAIGARYSDDPRVLLDGVDSLHSCGWRWFNQVQMVKKSFLCPPTLYDLQFYCVRIYLFSPGNNRRVTKCIAFCAFFTRIICAAVMLDHGGIWNTFGSRRRCSSTESSSTCSDCRR